MRGMTKEEARLMRCALDGSYEVDAAGGDAEEAVCDELVARGLLYVSRQGSFVCWHPTPFGLVAMRVCTVG